MSDHVAALERRLGLLEDKEAVRALLLRGWRALDRGDWGAWSACWAEDAVLEFGPWGEIRGRDAIRARVEEAESPYAAMQHHILNLHVEVEAAGDAAGDRATGIGYMWFVAVGGPAPGAVAAPYAMGGPYDWEFRRDPGRGWLVARQRLGVQWTHGADPLRAFE
ncbi:hypothetical protein SUDANB171_02991 [Streptomyces sp. enrichment culture]|uniref:nuclear transport factor 2 family protein n=1 Tax=Streptomyces sp. enrichment culture TaxID=1795815 RepID=UPI003F56A95D